MPVVRSAWSATTTSVVVTLVAGLIAGLAYGAWSTRHASWESTTTFDVSAVANTGDPDRAIATQIEFLESRTQREAIAEALTAPAPFTIGAEQRRLSNVIDVTVTSPQRATATRAAAVIETTPLVRASGAVLPVVSLTVLDPPQAATRVDDVRRDSLLVGLGGAALAVAALVLFYSLRPRVKRSYDAAPVGAMVLELPKPGRPGSPRRGDRTGELRRLAGLIITRGSDDVSVPQVSALAGVDDATLGWVTEALDGTTTTVVERPVPDGVRPWSVLVARAGVDAEAALRKEAASRAVFSEVMVVLLGAPRPALVAPAHARDSAQRSGVDDGSTAPHRDGTAVWR